GRGDAADLAGAALGKPQIPVGAQGDELGTRAGGGDGVAGHGRGRAGRAGHDFDDLVGRSDDGPQGAAGPAGGADAQAAGGVLRAGQGVVGEGAPGGDRANVGVVGGEGPVGEPEVVVRPGDDVRREDAGGVQGVLGEGAGGGDLGDLVGEVLGDPE